MTRSFVKLFDLEILHNYYTSGKCGDFLIQPTADTVKLIKGYRSVLKSKQLVAGSNSTGGVTLLYEATDKVLETPLIPITGEVRFRFGMKLINPAFLNFTSLLSKTNPNQVYYYTNAGVGSATLTPALIELHSKVFRYAFTSGETPDQLRVFGVDGAEIIALRKNLGTGPDFEVELDLQPYPDGRYKLELFDGGVTTGEFKYIYFDDQLKSQGVFAITEIVADDNSLTFENIKIQFSASQAYWSYFIVVREGVGTDDYVVDDGGETIPAIEFDLIDTYSDEEEATIAVLLNSLPDGDVVLYKTADPVSYSESKRKNLRLIKNAQISPPLIGNLPNPGVANPKSETFVFV